MKAAMQPSRGRRQSDLTPAIPAQLSAKVASWLRDDRVQIVLWADASGRVRRLQIRSSTGDAKLNDLIRDEVIASLGLDTLLAAAEAAGVSGSVRPRRPKKVARPHQTTDA
ncbi:MAG TPA: hypothetical protein VHB49_21860 [Bradyrhizobium sp.]|nr:hypothetical protein [Bradyrhizobium sp.]